MREVYIFVLMLVTIPLGMVIWINYLAWLWGFLPKFIL